MHDFTGSDSFLSLRALKHEVQNTLLLTGNLLRGRQDHRRSNLHRNHHAIPSLDLPLPEDVDYIFDDLKFPSHVLAELGRVYRNGLQQVQQLHRQKFEEACRDLCEVPTAENAPPLSLLLGDLCKVYESIYLQRHLPMLRNQILSLRLKQTPACETKKIPFNAEYTPLLEKYFEFNAYPSAPDRKVLAQKTAMSVRQIEVWFQNHRKRARENGRVVKRMFPGTTHDFFPALERLAFATASVNSVNKLLDIPIVLDEDDLGGHTVPTSSTQSVDAFLAVDAAGPSYVFPNPYSASTAIYHFHSDTKFFFPPVVWPRNATPSSIRRPDISFSDFISSFATLNMRDGIPKKENKRKTPQCRSHGQHPWFCATITIPSYAPHPALIRTARPRALSSHNVCSATNFSRRLPTTSPSGYPPPSLSSHNVCSTANSSRRLTATSSPHTPPRSPRKVAPFPKRSPTVKYHPYSQVVSSTPDCTSRATSSAFTTTITSRSSSLSSLASVPPASPALQAQNGEPFVFDNQDNHLLDELELCLAQQLPSAYDLHTSKHAPNPSYLYSYTDKDFSCLPVNFIQAQS